MHIEIVKALLVDPKVRLLAEEDDMLVMACNEGDVDLVKLLMEDGRADPTAYNNQAVESSSKTGRPEIVRLLLGDSRVTQALVQQAIVWALEFGNNDVARSLRNHPLVS